LQRLLTDLLRLFTLSEYLLEEEVEKELLQQRSTI
jgi:hypothetical protein